MDRSRFDTRADQFRAYAKELRATAGDCVAQAMDLVSGATRAILVYEEEHQIDLATASQARGLE